MKRILLVDDDANLLRVLNRYLTKQGYVVQAASSVQEALRLFELEPPDLIVSDVNLPEVNGLEFCKQVRRRRRGELLPFIFLSGCGAIDDRLAGLRVGADDYLPKPFEPRELVARIEAMLERARRTQAEMLRLLQEPSTLNTVQPRQTMTRVPEVHNLPLSPAERRVFDEIVAGMTNRQIAEKHYLSIRTVQSHVASILRKLSLERRSEIIRFAFEHNLVAR
ncbi:MAG: response regulator transcription factor [Anaerolineae bacterium]|nr:response regulator transcription factor [Gloeobacterales cyanobacterium ES-bin-313]